MAKIDDSVKKKVPELRFPGFTDNWQERKLGEVGKTKSGIGFPDAQQGGKQGTPFYKVSDMNNPGNEIVMMNANNYASDSQLKENKWNPINPQNSGVVFAKVGAAIFLDRKRIVDTSFLIDNNMMSYLFDSSWNRYFGKTLFEKLRLSIFAQVGALPSFNGSDVEDIKVMIPEESEQKMIGDMFEKLDDIIALHQRKLDLLKEQKKGYLQKMFPKNGAKVPELRFAGFADDWEERKLGNELTLLKDGTHGTHQNVLEGPLLLSAKNIKNGKIIIDEITDRKISVEEYNSIHKKFSLEKGDVLLTIVGSIGETAIIENPIGITFQRSVAYLRPSHTILSQFLFTTINGQKFQMELRKRQVVSAQPGIYLGDLSIIPILIPSVAEQETIGSFFKQLDETIALHQRKLDLLKEQKKGFLQKMFV